MPRVKRAAQAAKPVVLMTHWAKPPMTLAAVAMPMVALAVKQAVLARTVAKQVQML